MNTMILHDLMSNLQVGTLFLTLFYVVRLTMGELRGRGEAVVTRNLSALRPSSPVSGEFSASVVMSSVFHVGNLISVPKRSLKKQRVWRLPLRVS